MHSGTDVLIFIGIAAVVLAFWFWINARNRQRIAAYLQAKGATDITVSYVWFDFDRSNLTYDVVYTLHGQEHRNTCKTLAWLCGTGEFYWKDPV